MKQLKTCVVCAKTYTTYKNTQRTCSKQCMGINQQGSNNPNAGNTWSIAQRKHLSSVQKAKSKELSERTKQHWKDNYKRKEAARQIMSITIKTLYKTNPEIWSRKASDKTKLLISVASAGKFTDTFKAQQKSRMIALGFWRAPEQIPAYTKYFKEAEWIARMWDLHNTDILIKYGIFNAKTNPGGCVRDHMYGRRQGFIDGVPPILLRHPANCQILLHSDNIKKAKGHDCTMSLQELLVKIEEYKNEWKEHHMCIQIINQYKTTGNWEAFHV